MNKQQVSYLKKRIEQVRDEKIKLQEMAYQEACRKRKSLSRDQKLDLIYAGKVKLKPRKINNDGYGYGGNYLVDAFEFPQDRVEEKEAQTMRENHEARMEKLRTEATRIVDVAVFKDAEDAIKMLAAFEKF
jgi:RNA-binding protein YlmH